MHRSTRVYCIMLVSVYIFSHWLVSSWQKSWYILCVLRLNRLPRAHISLETYIGPLINLFSVQLLILNQLVLLGDLRTSFLVLVYKYIVKSLHVYDIINPVNSNWVFLKCLFVAFCWLDGFICSTRTSYSVFISCFRVWEFFPHSPYLLIVSYLKSEKDGKRS